MAVNSTVLLGFHTSDKYGIIGLKLLKYQIYFKKNTPQMRCTHTLYMIEWKSVKIFEEGI